MEQASSDAMAAQFALPTSKVLFLFFTGRSGSFLSLKEKEKNGGAKSGRSGAPPNNIYLLHSPHLEESLMTGKAASFGLPYLAAIAGVAGYFFHAALRGGGSSVPLIAFSILMCLLFLLAAAALDKQEAYADVYRKLPSDTALSLLGAAAVAAGCVLSLPGGTMFGASPGRSRSRFSASRRCCSTRRSCFTIFAPGRPIRRSWIMRFPCSR